MAAVATPEPKAPTHPVTLKINTEDYWKPLTPLSGPFEGFYAYNVPNVGAILWGPNGMVWCPEVKAVPNERDDPKQGGAGGYKLVRRGNG